MDQTLGGRCMAPRTYREFDLLVEDPSHDASGLRSLTVRLLASPAGEHDPVERRLTPKLAGELATGLAALEARSLDIAGVVGLGAALADLLLPSGIRAKLVESRNRLGADEGLRVRLRLDPDLAELPWEFAWVAQQAGLLDASGFLALDPRISIVRHETVGGPVAVDPAPRERLIVAALANPEIPGRAPLNLAAEKLNLEQALKTVPRMTVSFVDAPTIDNVQDALLDGADVFHFAGHGVADSLVIVDDTGAPSELTATLLAQHVTGRGVQLVVLGACESGMRAIRDRWSGVATRLIAAGVPAVVAMQFRIADRAAIAFSDRLYRSLAGGGSLDQAVSDARLAVLNLASAGRDEAKRARLWRDWGVPVLYLRPDAAVSLASVEDEQTRETMVEEATAIARVRVEDVEKNGKVVGAEVGVLTAGSVTAEVVAKRVEGLVVGLVIDRVDAGSAKADLEVGDVSGQVVGMKIENVGGPAPPKRRPKDR